MKIFFVTDLHGHRHRYGKLTDQIRLQHPDAVLIGGDILPHFARLTSTEDFIDDYLVPLFRSLKEELREQYPVVGIILGNDDPRIEEQGLKQGEEAGLWRYLHNRKAALGEFTVYGYSFVPPTPFRLKDWERYDVSRYVDPGCIPPDEGARTVDTGEDIEFCTIQKDLEFLTGDDDLESAIFLFHTPPYRTGLDRAALDGVMVDHVPVDVNVGSIAVKRFIEERQPRVTLHGHVHESTRLTGIWHEVIGRTHAFGAATDDRGLCLVSFDPGCPEQAVRTIL